MSPGEVENKIYAKRSDTAVVYELARNDYEGFLADYHRKVVFDAEDSEVASLSVMSGGVTQRFNRDGDGWSYFAEPDLPLDDAKIKNLLLQVLDMNLKRYVAYGVTDLSHLAEFLEPRFTPGDVIVYEMVPSTNPVQERGQLFGAP